MKKIGIYLGYGPDQPMTDEGLGRLLGFIVKGIQARDDSELVIACPGWIRRELSKLWKDLGIPEDDIQYVSTGIPIWVKWQRYIKDKKKEQNGICAKIIKRIANFIIAFSYEFVSVSTLSSFIKMLVISLILVVPFVFSFFISMMAGILIGVFMWLLMPVLVLLVYPRISSIVNETLSLVSMVIGRHRKQGSSRSNESLRIFLKKAVGDFSFSFSKIKSYFTNAGKLYGSYDRLRGIEFKKLIKKINKKKDVKAWLSPVAIWPEVAQIKANVIVVVPDVVFFDFPAKYDIIRTEGIIDNVYTSINAASQVITYSNYVKYAHVVGPYAIDENKVTVIPHAPIRNEEYLKSDDNVESPLSIINSFQNKKQKIFFEKYKMMDIYSFDMRSRFVYEIEHNSMGFDFEGIDFIINPTQARPNKNLNVLIEAMDLVVHKYNRDIKLVLTCGNYDMLDYELIYKKNMERHILIMPRVSNNVLIALYRLAKCNVNTAIFEAAFLFTFSEALSLGTPSIMAKSSMTDEAKLDEDILGAMTFDPYNPREIAKKIIWAVDNRDVLYEKEKKVYAEQCKRTWEDVANEYIGVLEKFSA